MIAPPALSVPFVYERHEIVVSVHVNGQGPFSMLVDTDTDPSAVDNRLARRLKLRPSGTSGRGQGVGGGSDQVTPFILSNLTLGPIQAHDVAAVSSDLAPLAQAFGHQIDGVLGRSFLKSRIIQIDFVHRQLDFLNAAPSSIRTARIKYALEVELYGVTVGNKPVTATLDTGNSHYVTVSGHGVAALQLANLAARAKTSSAHGYNGSAQVRTITLPALRIAAVNVGSVPALVFSGQNEEKGEPDINIGNRVLEKFRTVTFDFRGSGLWLGR